MDAWWSLDDLHQLKPALKPGGSRELPCIPSKSVVSISHQLVDIAGGLEHLHFLAVIHGDLKGVRVHTYTLSSLPY